MYEEYKVFVKIMPEGNEAELELPSEATGAMIIESLISDPDFDIQRVNPIDNRPYVYTLRSKGLGKEISKSKTLYEAGVQSGDTLILSPELVAGGGERGKMIHNLPSKAKIGKSRIVNVRVAKEAFSEYLLKNEIGLDNEINEIEISDIMHVTLKENARKEYMIVKNLSTKEQIVSDDFFSEWVFEIIPVRIGTTALLLKIGLHEIIKDFGERTKDVFLINQELDIEFSEKENFSFMTEFEEVFAWSEALKSELYDYIAKNETGLALSKLINFFQKKSVDLLHSIILLQAQWNDGKNKYLLNLIPNNDWMIIQNRINYAILELMKKIEQKANFIEQDFSLIKELNDKLENVIK